MIDKRLVFFEGKHILLKALSHQDIDESNWAGWFNNESLCTYNQHHYFPNTIESQRDHLSSCVSSNKIQLGIINKEAQDVICGVVSLSQIDWIHRHAEIAGFQDNSKTKLNPAIFLEAWTLILSHGFNQLGLNKIYGGTFHPFVSATLCDKFNFEVEGIRRSHVFKDGSFKDLTLLAVFKNTITYPSI